ncbi:MAG: hypothetical protein V4581_15360 [Bacteroidota bacterium]
MQYSAGYPKVGNAVYLLYAEAKLWYLGIKNTMLNPEKTVYV